VVRVAQLELFVVTYSWGLSAWLLHRVPLIRFLGEIYDLKLKKFFWESCGVRSGNIGVNSAIYPPRKEGSQCKTDSFTDSC